MAVVASKVFEHKPLSDAAAQLRLLKVSYLKSESDNYEHLHCSLTTHDIDAKPSYVAVSYTWGDPKHTKTITVNGKTLTVRHNCWYVLWQACANNISGFLWIDAICINQLDNEEKSLQVAMMGNIYRNADQVNVCLGPHSDDSQLLFNAAKEHALFVGDKLQSYRRSGGLIATLKPLQRRGRVDAGLPETADILTMSLFSQSVRAVLLAEMETRDKFSFMLRGDLEVLTEARYCLTERAYFTRLWICQEILLGRRVVLMVGESTVNFEDFLDFESDIVAHCLRQKSGTHAGVEFDASQEFLSIVNIRNGWSLTGMGLLELTDIFSRFQCFDVRDRIFGMLGMVDWQGYPRMIPDYKKTAFDVGVDAVSYMCPLLGGNVAERDNMSWPIVSAMQIASALSLDADNDQVKTRLQTRRSQRRRPWTSPETRSRPSQISPHVELIADFYCELFVTENPPDANLSACLVDRDHQPDSSFSDYVLNLEPDEIAGSRLIYGEDSPRVRVSNTAQAGDMVLSFRTNGTEVGIVVRREQDYSSRYLIVGQAVFHEATIPCPGGAKCYCGFPSMPHQQQDKKIKVHFDPEDILLFACQDLYKTLGEDPEGGENLRRFESIHAGEMIQVAALEELRFITSVVKPDQPTSSHAVMMETTGETTNTEEDHDMEKKLQALQLHLNGLRAETKD